MTKLREYYQKRTQIKNQHKKAMDTQDRENIFYYGGQMDLIEELIHEEKAGGV